MYVSGVVIGGWDGEEGVCLSGCALGDDGVGDLCVCERLL